MLEVYVPFRNPRNENSSESSGEIADGWAERGAAWRYAGPYSRKSDLAALGASRQYVDASGIERVEEMETPAVVFTADELVFDLPPSVPTDSLRGIWLEVVHPRELHVMRARRGIVLRKEA